jgi:hypothetical protein
VNLRNKRHCIFNEQVSEEAWKKFKRDMKFTPEIIRQYGKRAEDLRLTSPHPHTVMTNCEDCTGNYLTNCKNARDCYEGKDIEDSRYLTIVPAPTRDCQDMTGGGGELLYNCFSVGPGMRCAFCGHCWDGVSDLLYCAFCMNSSQHCFGCVGLTRAQYCIFNIQYSKEEYEILVPRIIEHMRSTSEWGEFFPAHMSPFAYNETIAQEHFPLNKDQALQLGSRWREVPPEVPEAEKIIPAERLPEHIADIPDDIVHWAILCAITHAPYRITKQELTFYREQGLPIPVTHPSERYRRRSQKKNPHKLWSHVCRNCGKGIETTYNPERPEIVYCEECYLQAVY